MGGEEYSTTGGPAREVFFLLAFTIPQATATLKKYPKGTASLPPSQYGVPLTSAAE
jgi:hypothetical protein